MQRLFTFLAFLLLPSLHAAAPAIGVATSSGSFQVNHTRVSGNTTVFDGAAVETEEATSRVRLHGGAWIELAAESRATIFAHRARLEEGFGELKAGPDFQVEARGLRISTASSKTLARIRLDGADTVLVGAVNGAVRVFSPSGILVANVNPGAALSFRPGAGGADEFKVSGCLLVKEKRYIVVDSVGNQTVEVRGDKLAAEVGNRVEVTGTAIAATKPVTGASQVIQVKNLTEIGRGGCVAAASSSNASTRVEAAKSHTGAIIAGVAIAGAGGGVAAAVCCKGSKSPTSP